MVKYSSFGYTLIEVMVVLSVAGILMVIAFVGISSYRKGDAVTIAANEFVTNVRSIQNKVDNGADGVSVKNIALLASGVNAKSYTADAQPVEIKNGAWISRYYTPGVIPVDDQDYPGPLSICFANRYLASYDSVNSCGPCNEQGSVGYICDQSFISQIRASTSLVVRFSNGSVTKDVVIEGSGMRINNVYAK